VKRLVSLCCADVLGEKPAATGRVPVVLLKHSLKQSARARRRPRGLHNPVAYIRPILHTVREPPGNFRQEKMEYAVRAETKEGDVVTLKRGFPSLSEAEDYPVRICSAAAASNFMIYEGVEFVIRAGLGRHEWTLLICYPDNVDRSPTVSQFSGSMGDATASARRRIDGWMRRQRRKARASA
jgi:hypothetical protein